MISIETNSYEAVTYDGSPWRTPKQRASSREMFHKLDEFVLST